MLSISKCLGVARSFDESRVELPTLCSMLFSFGSAPRKSWRSRGQRFRMQIEEAGAPSQLILGVGGMDDATDNQADGFDGDVWLAALDLLLLVKPRILDSAAFGVWPIGRR
ncbi:MAG: hypothetical protein EOQ98_34235 [Mesorhizobium sp.]|nr:MAG: hypothetical protein EOQ98_34235 [Mesorhizobium sp.]TIM51560.1 MAG: hypothetical protein E5Y69_04865 [Mesorhizobium sp.]